MKQNTNINEGQVAFNCAIYARYSSNLQKEKSIEDQIRTCRQYAEQRGWHVLDEHIYFDKAISGSGINLREGIQRLMEIAMSKYPPFQYILVDDTSRVARNIIDALKMFAELSFNNVYAYYVSQGIDTSEENAEELITLHGLMDARYLKELAKRTHRGLAGQVLKGFSGGGRRYGYKSEPIYSTKIDIYGNPIPEGYKIKIHLPEAEVITRIFRMFGEERLSAKKIVSILNSEIKKGQLPKPPRGEYWSVSTVLGSKANYKGILNNEMYIGKYIWNRTTSKRNPRTNKRISVFNPSIKWVEIDIPDLRIIDDDLWNKVKKRQKEITKITNSKYTHGKQLYSRNLLTGITKCGECGGNMVIVSGGKYAKYGCSNNWNKGDAVCTNNLKIDKFTLEERVISEVKDVFASRTCVDYITMEANYKIQEIYKQKNSNSKKTMLEEEMRRVDKELENIVTAIKMGMLTETVKELLNKTEGRKKEVLKEIEELLIPENKQQKLVAHPNLIKNYLKNLLNTLNRQPILGRAVLSELIDTVKIMPLSSTYEFEVLKKEYSMLKAG